MWFLGERLMRGSYVCGLDSGFGVYYVCGFGNG